MSEAEHSHSPANPLIGSTYAPTEYGTSFRDVATDAIRSWEPRRLVFNAALALVFLWHFLAHWPTSQRAISVDNVLCLFFLAVLANCCYCAAYIPDIFAQYTGFRLVWLRWRGLLLAIGILFASVITRFFCVPLFSAALPD
jgi:hypothetical protein